MSGGLGIIVEPHAKGFDFSSYLHMKTNQPNQTSIELLVLALKQQQDHLKEVLDAIEQRGISSKEVKDYLKWVQQNMREMRKSSKFGLS